MREFSGVEIQKALERLPERLTKYQWLQANVLKCDVSADWNFQFKGASMRSIECGGGPSGAQRFFAIDGRFEEHGDRFRTSVAVPQRFYQTT